MDYAGIIKRSWQITWKYRVLWLFGLFAGGISGSFSGSGAQGDSGTISGDLSGLERQVERGADAFVRWFTDNLGIAVAVVLIMSVAGFALWVISIAAQGGLVKLASEADQDRPVLGSEGWAIGFRYWGRTLLIQLVLTLPFAVLIGALVAATIISFIPAMTSDGDPVTAALGGVAMVCGVFAIAIPLTFVLAFVVGSVYLLALRYGILEDRPSFAAIGAAWGAFKARWKQVFGMWLALMLVGIIYGMLAAVIAVGFVLPAGVAFMAGNLPMSAALILLLALVMLLPNAIYAALRSTAWTVFFRRLTGVAEVV
ncbi:MAG: hypothetical protein FDZ70_08360, partial [Actinobacteria bacterium]